MLSELFIRDFAIIDELKLQLSPGFNVMTGETGAGKSIILDAMSLLLGERADTAMVRAGCAEAYVEGSFVLSPELQASIGPLLEQEGLEGEDDTLVLLARELRLNGRNICRVNGRAVSLSLLSELGDRLIDIHGQGEHPSLLKPRSHLPLLDAFGGLQDERATLAHEVAELRRVQRELATLRRDERTMNQRLDMLQFQIQEIDAANLKPGEDEALKAERTRLANVEQIVLHANEAMAILSSDDDQAPSVADLLGQAERAVALLARFDPTMAPYVDRFEGVTFQFNELASDLRGYAEGLELEPGRLSFVEERLELINRLKRKYGDDIGAVLALREAAGHELESISRSEERSRELADEEERQLRRVGELALALSRRRQEVAERLAESVERELADLHMAGAHFSVDFGRQRAPDGAYVIGEDSAVERYAVDASGIDRVEFLVSANPGEPPKPMAKVASGGETSRLMLALKTVLAQADQTPTLIFDEIDQGIGGRVGDVVGRKLWGLASIGDHQVIVVTHLPQLAGYGDAHFHVSKQLQDGRTVTAVASLDLPGRVRELAAMLGTEEEVARGGAESILHRAAEVKGAIQA
jgi:DNA repair protein RecN (Recombination protein N)